MLDAYLRKWIDPPLMVVAKHLAYLGVSANVVTLLGFISGLATILAIIVGFPLLGVFFLAFNRLCDGLDGALARINGLTNFGGFLDILCDFIIYAGVVFAFSIADTKNAFAASFLIFSFIGPITSFLAYAILAEKHKLVTDKRGKKSFYYLGGICEGTETAAILFLMCLWPAYFGWICLIYGVLCWFTTVGRAYCAWHDFA